MRRRSLVALVVGAMLIPNATVASFTWMVSADGSTDYDTISAAIEAAEPYDQILIAPGTYVENLHIDKPLTLTGDGAREDIVILHDESDRQIVEMDPDGPSVVTIYVDDVDVTLEHLSIMDEDDLIISVLLDGGTSTIRDIYANDFVGVRGDAFATIEDSYIERLGAWGTPNYTVATNNEIRDFFFGSEGARGRLEGNTVIDLPIVIESGASFEIVGNTIKPSDDEPGIVVVNPESTATITGNDVEGGFAGIILEFAGESLVKGNTFHGGELGVLAIETPSTIEGNTVFDVDEVGIVAAGHGMTVAGNDINGGRLGIHAHAIDDGPPDAPRFEEPPRILDNTVAEASHFAIVIEDSSPSVSGNELCAGRKAFQIAGDSEPTILSNEICEVDG